MDPDPPVEEQISQTEINRTQTFIWIQVFFLLVSPFAGGFNYNVRSPLDSAIIVASIGITGFALVLGTKTGRKKAFKAAVVHYVVGVFGMSLNILLSG